MYRDLDFGEASLSVLFALGLMAGCGEQEAPDDVNNPVRAPEIARVIPADEAIAGAHIPTLDPVTMFDAEIRKVVGPGPRCEFQYTSEGRPVLAVRSASGGEAPDGVVKLNGHLVPLRRASAEAGPVMLSAGRIRLTVTPNGGEQTSDARREANTIFEVGNRLRVGYRGYYRCTE